MPDNLGAWESEVGLSCYGHPDTSLNGVQFEWHLGDAYNVTKIRLEVSVRGGDQTTVARPTWIKALTDQGPQLEQQLFHANNGTTREIQIELFNCPETRIIQIGSKIGSTGGGSYVKVTRVTVWMEEQCPPAWSAFCTDNA
jgi:hypothetical protein